MNQCLLKVYGTYAPSHIQGSRYTQVLAILASILYEDNDAATAMANAQKPTSRTRHMDIKYFVLCEWVERDLVKLERVDTSLNMADNFTKQLGPTLFNRHVDYIMGHVPPHYSACYNRMIGGMAKEKTKQDITPFPLPTSTPLLTSVGPAAAAAAKLYVSWSWVNNVLT